VPPRRVVAASADTMSSTPQPMSRGTGGVNEAEARFRTFSEALAVRLRWLSIAAIPLLAYASGKPLSHPGFELLVASAGVYNFFVARSLARGPQGRWLSLGTGTLDSLYIFGMSALSGGLDSVITIYAILAMASICMRLPTRLALGVAVLYGAEFTLLALIDGALSSPMLPVKVAYVFLTVAFVSPLVSEARKRFVEVVTGHGAQRTLLHRLLRSVEEERRRIANDLHDRGGGALFAMLHGLRRIRELVAVSDNAPRAEVDRLIRITEMMVRELRTFIADLRPNVLDDLGLNEALRELLSRERALSGVRFSLDVDADAHPDPESALAFYRVAQEALTNIRRHAAAKAAIVRFKHDDEGWRLQIEDDGAAERAWVPGMGIRTMHERVEALGGKLEIDSNGGGTKISAWVPFREAAIREMTDGNSSLSR
jgi:signal transduction histidine kinase